MDAAFELFGQGGEAAVSIRSVCRVSELNSRYFYESFTDTDGLLSAVYDRVVLELGTVLVAATVGITEDDRARLRAGLRAVLEFAAADPRRGRILFPHFGPFVQAGANPVLRARRAMAVDQMRKLVLTDRLQTDAESDRVAAEVGSAIFAGAMAEIARQWLSGSLGEDLDAVVDSAAQLLIPAAPR